MKVELMSIEKLVPYARNPRITAHAVDKVAASIKEFGFRQPIVVDSEMVIIVGHVRYQAAQKLALKKVPVHVMEGATPEQVKAYRIADNRTGEHDFGKVVIDGQDFFWKIDYYDHTLCFGSENPVDPNVTTRVLTIMMASEY
jgi:ParB-like chromosome segregation protein Spo0J